MVETEVGVEFSLPDLLKRLQTRDECQRIEAKESRTALGKSALETISSFSNEPGLEGGYLLLGFRPKNEDECERYSLQGVNDPDKIQQEIVGVCRDSFNVQIRPDIRVEVINGKILIAAYIPETFPRNKPVFIKKLGVEKGSYRRIGSCDLRCTSEDLDLLYQLRSGCPYENEVLPYSEWQDVDLEAISEYRIQRSEIDPKASELRLGDQDLLLSLGVAILENGKILPTVAGLLLFGSKAALRRLMPMSARVDYILAEGTEWVQDPSTRYHAIDYREPLILLMHRLHSQVMSDLPVSFSLKEGDLQRSDIPSIPRNVIREALANALMHRDYRIGQPTQIIRYSNRIEFRNAGYSLKPFEKLGEPGSKSRNDTIASVFRELKYAETKGTGIRSMREWMNKAGLSTPPLIETDRERNEFDLLLLPHHLLDKNDLNWLVQFKEFKLSDAEMRTLVLTRELGAITNQDYRQINGTDTLTASKALVHLRDLGLLLMKGSGNCTYYVLAELETKESQISPLHKGLTPYINPLCKGLAAIPEEFPEIPDSLKEKVTSLGKRPPRNIVKDLIKDLCSFGYLQSVQLGKILDRDPQYLRIHFLSKMTKTGELVYRYPDRPAHPQQAYKVSGEDIR